MYIDRNPSSTLQLFLAEVTKNREWIVKRLEVEDPKNDDMGSDLAEENGNWTGGTREKYFWVGKES